MKRATTVFLGVLLAACGGSTTKDGTDTTGGGDPPVDGGGATGVISTGDYPVTATEALSYLQDEICPPFSSDPAVGIGDETFGLAYLIVDLDDAPGRCTRLAAGQEKASSGAVRLSIVRKRPVAASLGLRTGTYAWGLTTLEDGTEEEVSLYVYGFSSSCAKRSEEAAGGSATIDSFDATGVRGSLSFQLPSGGTVGGSFSTTPCGVSMFYGCTGFPSYPVISACVY
jgi:hypothetical protein